MTKLKVCIFDVDGTLADTERDGHRVSFNKAFAEAGLDWDWDVELYGRLLSVTGGKERIRHYIENFNASFAAPADLDGFIADLHAAKTVHYTELLAAGQLPLRPGVRRLINEARASGYRLAIATTTTPINVSALLRHSLAPDAEQWFDVIAAGDIVPAKKPAADIYHHTLEKMGVDPAECIAFEDSGNGLRSALGAGVRTLMTLNGYTRQDDTAGALLVLDHLGEPDRPFRVLKGDAMGATFVNMELLQRL